MIEQGRAATAAHKAGGFAFGARPAPKRRLKRCLESGPAVRGCIADSSGPGAPAGADLPAQAQALHEEGAAVQAALLSSHADRARAAREACAATLRERHAAEKEVAESLEQQIVASRAAWGRGRRLSCLRSRP